MYELYYNPFTSVEIIKPVMSLAECLELANQKDLATLINIVRVNWIVNDLRSNIVCKPLLLRKDFQVVTGDTRMMAIGLHPYINDVPALLTVEKSYTVDPEWIQIKSLQHLAELIGTQPENILCNENWNNNEVTWIEFAMPHTAHHLHDESQRERMILNYLEQYPDTVFDYDWLRAPIDWITYDSL
jgi:hypothetical protein